MHARPPDRRPLQFHRIENRDRIDQSGSRRAPLHFAECRLLRVIRPFKSDGIPGELGCRTERVTVGNIVQKKYQSVGWNIVCPDFLFKVRDPVHDCLPRYSMVFDNIEPLLFQKQKLLLAAVVKIYLLRCSLQRGTVLRTCG